MKILFITAGLNPDPARSNAYQEALMDAMHRRGHDVSCLCTAEVSAVPGVRWEQAREPYATRFRIFNGGVYPAAYPGGGVGSLRPLRDARASASLRRALLEIVARATPDVVNIQSLFGLPFDLALDIRRHGIPVVFTAHDYFALCPTAHLFLPGERRCRLPEGELLCRACCARSPSYTAFRLSHLLDRRAQRIRSAPALRRNLWRARNAVRRLDARVSVAAGAKAYSRRRREALTFLAGVDVLHCLSRLQAAVLRELAGPLENLRILPLVPPTVGTPPGPRPPRASGDRVRFVALNIHAPHKGSALLERVFGKLPAVAAGYELHVYGNHLPGSPLPSVFYHGRYGTGDLDRMAAAADFCIVPSVCDETLGFAGLEMLARGTPLIASSRAGVSEYVNSGVDGFVFDPASDDTLLGLLRQLTADCELRRTVQANLNRRGRRPLRFDAHVAEVEALLAQAAGRPTPGPDRPRPPSGTRPPSPRHP